MEEISSALLLNQKATDRPDLTIRVFRMKLRELFNDICVKHVLGRPSRMYTPSSFKSAVSLMHTSRSSYLIRINLEILLCMIG